MIFTPRNANIEDDDIKINDIAIQRVYTKTPSVFIFTVGILNADIMSKGEKFQDTTLKL